MKVCFFHSDKPRERLLADALRDGIEAGGKDAIELRPLTGEAQVAEGCDVAIMVGVKSKAIYKANWAAGIHVVMVDKGYTRHAAPGPVKLWEYWRVSIDAHHPTEYLMKTTRPFDRLQKLGLTITPQADRSLGGNFILIAGSSAKYHEFYGLREPTTWSRKLVTSIRAKTERPIVYRPKPSWREAVPIEGTEWSTAPTMEDALRGCRVMVTHGSNACFEAMLAGVPTICLGPAVARDICSQTLDDIENAPLPDLKTRAQWAANLAYCQWTMAEFASGEAWKHMRAQIYG